MEKPAETQYPIHDLLRRRWSPRAFSSQPVSETDLLTLLEAARWAPSCYNDQPWYFLVARKENAAEYERMLGCLVEFNQQWAKTAPVLMISVASSKFSRNGKPNRHGSHDVGLAAENLVIQAMALGIFVHQMGGFDVAKTRQVYSIPEGYDPVAAIALGYPGEANLLPAELAKRETELRERKGLKEFVFAGQWGHPPAWVK